MDRSNTTCALILGAVLSVAIPGCSTSEDTGNPPGTIALENANNYSFEGTLDIPSVETASGVDICVDWSKLNSDLQCHSVDPANDIDLLGVIRFPTLTEAEVESQLSTNDLDMKSMGGYVQYPNDEEATSACLSDFSFFGTAFDLATDYTEDGGTYLLELQSGTTPGVGARMLVFLEPRVKSDVTEVNVPNGCGMLHYSADLHTLTTVPVSLDGPWVMDWSDVTTDGLGNDMTDAQIDLLEVAHYDSVTVTDLENDFLDIEQNADEMWSLSLTSGKSGDLSDATNGASKFSAFQKGGTWILALRCSSCSNPAPLFLTVLGPA
jgi:hypothetical protein